MRTVPTEEIVRRLQVNRVRSLKEENNQGRDRGPFSVYIKNSRKEKSLDYFYKPGMGAGVIFRYNTPFRVLSEI